jgi:hypothetical protein
MDEGKCIVVLFVIWQGKVYSCTICYMAEGKFIAVVFVIWKRESV